MAYKRCPVCGGNLTFKNNICPHCGCNIHQYEDEIYERENRKPQNPFIKLLAILGGIIFILGLAIFFILLIFVGLIAALIETIIPVIGLIMIGISIYLYRMSKF